MPEFSRWIAEELADLVLEEPAIILQGPRASGKTTLLRKFVGPVGTGSFVDLADDDVLTVARQDPAGYLRGLAEPVVIDEFQRLPAVLSVVKRSVDQSRRTGQFILTGSTTSALLPKGSETLAGRSHDMTLWGLSQGEIRGIRERFVDTAFGDPNLLLTIGHQAELREDYASLVAVGGFPEAVLREREEARRRWLTNYALRVIERDLPDLVRLRSPQILRQVFKLCAARTAQIANLADFANDLRASRDTVASYVEMLERVFLVSRLPAFSRNFSARVTKHPKLHVNDTGLAAADCNLSQLSLRRHVAFGGLLESFVVAELRKQLGWSRTSAELFHYRDRDGHEVDLVLESPDGRVIAIEVKSATTVEPGDVSGLRYLADRLGSDFVHGIVLYPGKAPIRLGDDDRFMALPISALWASYL